MDVSRAARDQLKTYQAALQADLGRRATLGEIISAMCSGVPLWQAVAMLDTYRPRADPGSSQSTDS